MTVEPPPPSVPSTAVDPASFEALYRDDWRSVVALGWSLTGDRAVAEEIAQEAFLAAYRRWDHVGGLDRPGGWVRRVVANRSIDHHRRARVAAKGVDRLRAERSGLPGDEVPLASEHEVFWAAVRALPERQAQCVALHYLEDRSVDEIAGVLDLRPPTVRVHLHRGRKALARTLGLVAGGPSSESHETSEEQP